MMRTVCRFSCGAASAVATRLILDEQDTEIVYADLPLDEHPDNARFLRDCESWFGKPITRVRSDKYTGMFDVFRKRRFICSRAGCACSKFLKRVPLDDITLPDDELVIGYTGEEVERANRLQRNLCAQDLRFPLIERGMTKRDCVERLVEKGIQPPAMYRMGYHNNNCIGCVKGGAGYWNKIRKDFPDRFNEMAAIERDLDVRLLRVRGKYIHLDELPRDAGRNEDFEFDCGPYCERPTLKQLSLSLSAPDKCGKEAGR